MHLFWAFHCHRLTYVHQGMRNHARSSFAGSYCKDAAEKGTSGPTYKHGFKRVSCMSAILRNTWQNRDMYVCILYILYIYIFKYDHIYIYRCIIYMYICIYMQHLNVDIFLYLYQYVIDTSICIYIYMIWCFLWFKVKDISYWLYIHVVRSNFWV